MRVIVASFALLVLLFGEARSQGSVIVRVDDPFGSHCIDANLEEVTIYIRRIFLDKTQGIFTEDNRAGVLVAAKLTGQGNQPTTEVEIPSVSLVSVADESAGRISLPLEYPIASYLSLNQGDLVTTDIQLSITIARLRAKNTFGEVLDTAGKALDKLPIPKNPYLEGASKFLEFANEAIKDSTNKQLDVPFAHVSLSFNRGREIDLQRCESAGKERTGAIAVVKSTGSPRDKLIPTVDTAKQYCFTYSSTSTYELLATPRTGPKCPTDKSVYQAVYNNYVLFILSSHRRAAGFAGQAEQEDQLRESRSRCSALGLNPSACGG